MEYYSEGDMKVMVRNNDTGENHTTIGAENIRRKQISRKEQNILYLRGLMYARPNVYSCQRNYSIV